MRHIISFWGENKTFEYITHINLFVNAEHQLLLRKVFFSSASFHKNWLVLIDHTSWAKIRPSKRDEKNSLLYFSTSAVQYCPHLLKYLSNHRAYTLLPPLCIYLLLFLFLHLRWDNKRGEVCYSLQHIRCNHLSEEERSGCLKQDKHHCINNSKFGTSYNHEKP